MPLPLVLAPIAAAAPEIAVWIGAVLARIFASRLGAWLASALLFLGLNFAVHKVATEPLMDHIRAVSSGLSAQAVHWIAFFNLDKYISIIVSAYAIAAGSRVLLKRLVR